MGRDRGVRLVQGINIRTFCRIKNEFQSPRTFAESVSSTLASQKGYLFSRSNSISVAIDVIRKMFPNGDISFGGHNVVVVT